MHQDTENCVHCRNENFSVNMVLGSINTSLLSPNGMSLFLFGT